MPRFESFYEDDSSFREPDFVLRWYDRWKGQILLEGTEGRQWVKDLTMWADGVTFMPTEEPLSGSVQAKFFWETLMWGSSSIEILSSAELAVSEDLEVVVSRVQFVHETRRPGFEYYVERKHAGQAVSRDGTDVMTTHKVWRDSDREKGHLGHLRWTGKPGQVMDAYVGVLAVHCSPELP